MSPGSRPSHGTFHDMLEAAIRTIPRITIRSPKPRRILPRSLMCRIAPCRLWARLSTKSKRELGLPAGRDLHGEAEMGVRRRRRPPAVGASYDVPNLQEKGL